MTKRIEIKGIENIIFDSFPNAPQFGHKWPPPGSTDSLNSKASHANAVLQKSIMAMESLDAAVYAVRKDASRTPRFRAESVAPYRLAARKKIEESQADLKTEAQRIALTKQKLFAPPPLDAADFAGAFTDMEIRQRYSSMPPAAKRNLEAQINKHDPTADRVAYALARDPFSTAEAEWARAVHADRITKTRPHEVADLAAATERLEWASASLAALSEVLRKTEADALPPLIPEVQAA